MPITPGWGPAPGPHRVVRAAGQRINARRSPRRSSSPTRGTARNRPIRRPGSSPPAASSRTRCRRSCRCRWSCTRRPEQLVVLACGRHRRHRSEPRREVPLDLRVERVLEPEVGAVRVGRVGVQHRRVGPTGRALFGHDARVALAQDVHLERPRRARDGLTVREVLDLDDRRRASIGRRARAAGGAARAPPRTARGRARTGPRCRARGCGP